MNYSLLDTFMIWIGPWWLLAGVIAFIVAVLALTWSFRCHQRNEAARQTESDNKEKEWEAKLRQRSEWYERDAKIRRAYEAEERRIEKAKDDCLSNSTRRRYSKQVRTLP